MPRPPVGRQQLLTAARDELVAGNGSLELSGLTRRTGLSTGVLYHHFGSKGGLLASLYTSFFDGLNAAIADAHLPVDADWATRERERTRRFVVYHFDDPLAPLMLDGAALDPLLTELDAGYVRDIIGKSAVNIRRGQRTGDIARSIDADSAAAYVMGGLRHGIAQQLRLTPRPSVNRATDRLWGFIAGTLGLR